MEVFRWTLIGLFLRILIMPFTMHFDLIQSDYIADSFFHFGRAAFDSNVIKADYYPPMMYIIKAPFLALAHLFSPGFRDWLILSQYVTHQAIPYDNWLILSYGVDNGIDVFRNLFLSKIYYLVADFYIGFILLAIVSDKSKALWVFKAWMLNILVLHSIYAHGSYDLTPVIFLVTALYFAIRGHNSLSILFLVFGGWCKIFPFLLIPPLIIAAESRAAKRIKYFTLAAGLTVILYLILKWAADWKLEGIITGAAPMMWDFSIRIVNFLRKAGFAVTYGLFLIYLHFKSREPKARPDYSIIFLITLMILFTFQPIGFRYWIWISPMVILYLVENKKHWYFFAFNLFCLLVLRLFPQQSLIFGLFCPLFPEYFSTLPKITDITGNVISTFNLLRLMNIMFIFSSFAIVVFLWRAYKSQKKEIVLLTSFPRYCFLGLAVFISLLLTIGIWQANIKDNQSRTEIFKDVFLTGYRGVPDTLSGCLESGHCLDQVTLSPVNDFSSIDIWLSYDSLSSVKDSVILSLNWQDGGNTRHAEDGTTLDRIKNGAFHRFRFGNVNIQKSSPLHINLVQTGSGNETSVRVGLIGRKNKIRFYTKDWYVLSRNNKGSLEFISLPERFMDFRLFSSTIEPNWQMAMAFFNTPPVHFGQVLEIIFYRLSLDRDFIIFYLGLLLLLLSGIISSIPVNAGLRKK